MVNFGPNDQDPRDSQRGGETVNPRESGGHARRGQAESSVQTNHYEPSRRKEGHE